MRTMEDFSFCQTITYTAWGLNIASCLELPGFLPGTQAPDVTIRFHEVPAALHGAEHSGVCFDAGPGRFLLRLQDIARYLVVDGKEIHIEPAPGAEPDAIRLFLLGSVIGALLHQRGILPLHASAIRVNGSAIAFAGDSGVGKSTLAAAFLKRGKTMVADDICAVTVENNTPLVWPGSPNLKLWHDALQKLDEDPASLARVRASMEKYRYPVETGFDPQPLPLRKLYILRATNEDRFAMDRLSGAEKLNVLLNITYRFGFLKGLGGKNQHFRQCAAIGRQTEVSRVRRPRDGFRIEELIDLLQEDFGQ